MNGRRSDGIASAACFADISGGGSLRRVSVVGRMMAAPVIFRAAAALSRRVARRHRRVTASACWASVTPRGDRGVGTTAAAAAAGGSPSRDGVGSGRNGGGPLPIPPPLRTYYADWAEVILPDGHRFPMEKYRATRLALEADPSLRGKMELLPSPKAQLRDVLAVHEEGYVRRVLDCKLTEKEARTIGFPMHPSSVVRSLASTGGTVAATHDVLRPGSRHKAAAQIAGGTHHAFAGWGEGFCVFNDIAVAAVNALERFPERLAGSPSPVLIIDLDVHQGNGTAKIFEEDDRVVTFSMHGAGNYPWKTKMRSTHDVDLPDDTNDEDYLKELAGWLPYLFDTYDPRLVYFQAGVDALKEDSFGRLGMTRSGLLKRNHMVYNECVSRDVPLVITMGGGYSRPPDASIAVHADVFRSAAYRFASPSP